MFVGDSLSLNQWQSLTCMLHKAVPGANYTLARTGGVSTFRFPVWLFSLSTCNLERANLVIKKILKTMKKKITVEMIKTELFSLAWKYIYIYIYIYPLSVKRMRLYKKKYARKLFIIWENDITQKLIHIVLHTRHNTTKLVIWNHDFKFRNCFIFRPACKIVCINMCVTITLLLTYYSVCTVS